MMDIDTKADRRDERNRVYGIVRLLSPWPEADRRLSIVTSAILNGESVDVVRQQLEPEERLLGRTASSISTRTRRGVEPSAADDRDRAPPQQSGGHDHYGWNRVVAKLNKPDAEHTEDAA